MNITLPVQPVQQKNTGEDAEDMMTSAEDFALACKKQTFLFRDVLPPSLFAALTSCEHHQNKDMSSFWMPCDIETGSGNKEKNII